MAKKNSSVRVGKKRKMNIRKAKRPSPTLVGQIIRGIGGMGGGMLGNMVGMGNAGTTIGTGLGAAVSKWLGQGGYRVKSNSIVKRSTGAGGGTNIPNMHRNGQSIMVSHREYVSDVIAGSQGPPTTFNINGNNKLALNPGNELLFPWLSGIAQQFQEYTFKGVVFHYVSTSGESVASTNTALGSVMIATQYRTTAAAYTSKQQMLNEYFASDGKPSEDFCHPIECDPRENPYNVQYVRFGPVPPGEDPKTYDLGTVYVATDGFPGASTICGELWVSYEVELRKPLSIYSEGGNLQSAHYYSATGITTSVPLGTAQTQVFDTVGLTFNDPTGTTLTFPIGATGSYLLVLSYATVSVASFAGFLSTLTHCSLVSLPQGDTSGHIMSSNFSGDGTAAAIAAFIINIPDSTLNASIVFAPTTLTGVSQLDLYCSQVQQGLT